MTPFVQREVTRNTPLQDREPGLLAALFGEGTFRLMHIFWPLIIIYALSFFFILLERLQLKVRVLNIGVIAIFILLNAMPLILALLPPRQGIPYPPYFPPYISHISDLLKTDEFICTDMPWATAW